jgi:peptidyl-prolyl cis-trans isomerase D
MLDLFRKRGLTSFVYGFIIIATIAVFVIQFRPNAGQKAASLNQACVATVRGWCIDPKDHKAVIRVLMPRDQSGAASSARARAMNLNRIAADALIERELLVNEAERIGLRVSEQEITDSIFDGLIYLSVPSDRPELFPQFPVQNGRVLPQMYGGFRDPKTKVFDMKTYERTIRGLMGRSAAEFREEQGREILASKMRELVRAPIRVSDDDAYGSYTRERSNATIGYVSVKLGYASKYLVLATPANVDAWTKDKVNADLVEATIRGLKDDEKPREGHIRHILVKVDADGSESEKSTALAKIADAVRRVKAGELFSEVAKEVSADHGSAMNGGDVGDKTEGFVPPFKNAADALKPGEMTPSAIETQFGYHVIVRDDPNPELLKTHVARSLYVKARALEAAKDIATKVAAAIKSGKSGDEAVTSVLEPIMKRAIVWPAFEAVAESKAQAPVDGGVADAKDASAPTAKSSDEKKLTSRAVTWDDDPSRPRLETSSAFNRGGDPVPGLANDASQKLVAFAFSAKEGDLLDGPLRTDDGFLVAQLKNGKTATRDEFNKEREAYVQTLLVAKQAEALSVYVKRLREEAKAQIKVDETYLQEAGSNRDGGAPSPEELEEE